MGTPDEDTGCRDSPGIIIGYTRGVLTTARHPSKSLICLSHLLPLASLGGKQCFCPSFQVRRLKHSEEMKELTKCLTACEGPGSTATKAHHALTYPPAPRQVPGPCCEPPGHRRHLCSSPASSVPRAVAGIKPRSEVEEKEVSRVRTEAGT